jgi:peptidoglycan hydrolase-like protein with peptidoglycan-binding domain
MTWRLAESLMTLRSQINRASPNRAKASDGTVGDTAHASRSSDHNPWIKDGRVSVVSALDITHDPSHGVDAGKIAEVLRLSKDSRIKYIISNGRICSPDKSNFAWRPYTGKNPHTKHFHISVKAEKRLYDDAREWDLSGFQVSSDVAAMRTKKLERRLLKKGARGKDVEELQKLLGIPVDGSFGVKTEEAVKDFQRKAGLEDDGKVGLYTWDAILKMEK